MVMFHRYSMLFQEHLPLFTTIYHYLPLFTTINNYQALFSHYWHLLTTMDHPVLPPRKSGASLLLVLSRRRVTSICAWIDKSPPSASATQATWAVRSVLDGRGMVKYWFKIWLHCEKWYWYFHHQKGYLNHQTWYFEHQKGYLNHQTCYFEHQKGYLNHQTWYFNHQKWTITDVFIDSCGYCCLAKSH